MKELLEKLKALFKGTTPPSDDDIQKILDDALKSGTALKDFEIEQLKTALKGKGKSTDDNSEVAELKQMNLSLQQQLTNLTNALADMKKDRDAGVEAQKEQSKKDLQKRKEDTIKEALKVGKVIESTKAFAEKMFDTNPDIFDEWVKTAPVHPEFKPTKDESGRQKTESKPPTLRGALDAAPQDIMSAMQKMDGSSSDDKK